MAVLRINDIGISVQDVDRAADFWSNQVGLEVERVSDTGLRVFVGKEHPESPPPLRQYFYVYKTENENPQPVQRNDDWLHNPLGVDHIALRVDDLEKSSAEMEARGVTFMSDIVGDPGNFRFRPFADPEGNVFFINHAP